jgi:hypothetical protein
MQHTLRQHMLLLQPLLLCLLLGWLQCLLSCQSVACLPRSWRWIGTWGSTNHSST